MVYTVKQLADMAGVSPRTLHYYDQIGLLEPSSYSDNGYRQYRADDLLRLQQILFYKELGLSLKQIEEVIGKQDFDLLQALDAHKAALEKRVGRLNTLIETVEATILHIKGELPMSNKGLFQGFSEEQQKEYEAEAMEKYDPKLVKQSQRRWKNYSDEQKRSVRAEGDAIFQTILAHIDEGPQSPAVQEQAAAYHRYIHTNFYDCSYETIGGLGQMYVEDARFRAKFDELDPKMAEFVRDAFAHYAEGKTGLLN